MKIFVVAFATVVLYTLLGKFNAEESEDVDSEIDDEFLKTWKTPEYLKKKYPCYMSGYDGEGRPVWIFEFGRWNVNKIVDGGALKIKEFDTYYNQLFSRINRSIKKSDTAKANKKSTGWVSIVGFETYSNRQLTSISTLSYVTQLAKKYNRGTRNMDYGYFINMNYFAETLINNILAPVLRTATERTEIHGKNKAKWLRSILEHVPKYSLPEKYGGYANFTPIDM